MSLRRTALQRRTELKRTPMPRHQREAKDRVVRTVKRQRDTGPTSATREIVAARANWCCEICGRSLFVPDVGWVYRHSTHHRRPRGMGGTSRPDTNEPSNLMLVCGNATSPGDCHSWIESNRAVALVLGYLVDQAGDPETRPVELYTGRRVFLTVDGTYADAA